MSKVATTGAMTFSFIKAIESGQATTYGNMLNSMRSTIRNTDLNPGGDIVTSLITMLLSGASFSGRLKQVIHINITLELCVNIEILANQKMRH